MRLLILPLALVISGQALAQDRPATRSVTAEQVGDALSNPVVQAGIAGLASAFVGTVLDTRIGTLARYNEDVRPNDTLGDIVRREDPRFDENLQRNTRRAIAAAGQITRDGVVIAGEVSKTADRLRVLLDGTAALVKAYTRDDD